MLDFIMFDLVESIQLLCNDDRLLDAHPALTPYMARMRALPRFGDYLTSDRCIKAPFTDNPACKVPF